MLGSVQRLRSDLGFMKYFKNTSWLFAERILRMTVGLFVGVWVARYLGPEQFGLFSYAQSFVGLFAVIASLGLDSIVVRELVNGEHSTSNLLGTSFILKIMGALLTLIVLAIAVNFTSNDSYTNTLVFIIASATVFQSFNVVDLYFQSVVLSRYVVFANVISLFISSVLKVILILNDAALINFAYLVLFDAFVLLGGLVYFYVKVGFSFRDWVFDRGLAAALLKDSWPFILSGGVLMLQARIDQVMIKEMIGAIEVGYYSVAMRLIEVFAFVSVLLHTSLFPAIQKAKNVSQDLYQERLLNYYRLNFLAFLIVAPPIFFFAEELVVLLFGDAYKNAGVLLSLLAIRLFFVNMGMARSSYIISENLMKFSLVTMVAGTVINIILNYFWIQEYGAKGAVLATIVSFLVTIYVLDFFYVKTRGNALLQIKSILTFYQVRLKN